MDGPETAPSGGVQVGVGEWRDVDTALGSPCGITSAGGLACALEETSPVEPAPIGSETDWSEIAAHYHACAFKQDDSLWCWGRNGDGQVGDGSAEDRASPVKVID